jgi:hypothetical protein
MGKERPIFKQPHRPSVDVKVYDLAVHFLSDHYPKEIPEDEIWDLADVIQCAIEFHLQGIEERRHG